MSDTIRKPNSTKWAVGRPINPEKPWQVDSRPSGTLGRGSRGEAPSWWNRLFDNVPLRRRDKAACRAILKGEQDPDDLTMGVIERRPHRYYW